jgi:tRNA (guanine37-N1)-methyltransferase
MQITVLSLFPQIIESYFQSSITARAIKKGLLTYSNINIRDYAIDKHRKCDDAPFGGGAGVILKAEPLAAAIEANTDRREGYSSYCIYPSPSGRPFTQQIASRLSEQSSIMLIAGRYEGIDQRIIDLYVDEELSVGNYVMASGELSSLVIIDTVMRLIKGVIKAESLEEESFNDGLLEYPQYTRPEIFKGMAVPKVLMSGNHKEIKHWRYEKSIEKTLANLPNLGHNGEEKK